jgi:hypothetical protein
MESFRYITVNSNSTSFKVIVNNDNDIETMRVMMLNISRCKNIVLKDIYGTLERHNLKYTTEFNKNKKRNFEDTIVEYLIYIKNKLKYSKEVDSKLQDIVNKVIK